MPFRLIVFKKKKQYTADGMVNIRTFLSFGILKYDRVNTSMNNITSDAMKSSSDFFRLITIFVVDNTIPNATKKNAKNKPFRVLPNIQKYIPTTLANCGMLSRGVIKP